MKIFLCGGAAACLATFVTHPADVVKTYVQLHPSEFSGLIDGFAIIYRVSKIKFFKMFHYESHEFYNESFIFTEIWLPRLL